MIDPVATRIEVRPSTSSGRRRQSGHERPNYLVVELLADERQVAAPEYLAELRGHRRPDLESVHSCATGDQISRRLPRPRPHFEHAGTFREDGEQSSKRARGYPGRTR